MPTGINIRLSKEPSLRGAVRPVATSALWKVPLTGKKFPDGPALYYRSLSNLALDICLSAKLDGGRADNALD